MTATLLAGLLAALALPGIATALLAARAVRRFAVGLADTPPPPALPPASVLKPLHRAEPGLAGNLGTALRQDYPSGYEVLFAVADPADPAATVAEAAMAAHPDTPARLLRDPRQHGSNRKVSQLVNMTAAAAHPVLVAVDADMRTPPQWLARVVTPLADPGVGVATCLYHAVPADAGLWSLLGALGVDWHFLPAAILGESVRRSSGCYGATVALRRDTLDGIGGFRAVADLLADDHALGAVVRRRGLRVAVAPVLPGHVMHEPSLRALWEHELRWARTVRGLDPSGYLGLALTHPLPPAVLCAALAPWGLAVLAAALAARLILTAAVDKMVAGVASPPGAAGPQAGAGWRRLALLPLRDGLSFAIWATGLARGTVRWQGRQYRVRPDGAMTEVPLRGQ